MVSLKERITEDMKIAMRAKETVRLGAIRLLLAAIKQREVDERVTLDDTAVMGLVSKLIKQRKDSIAQFEQAGRQDLVQQEAAELAVLEAYLPPRMSEQELVEHIKAIVTDLGATSVADLGKVLGLVKSRLAGQADMAQAAVLAKQLLS